MKKHWSYVRTIFLSILVAFIIDTAINFDEYRRGWLAGIEHTNNTPYTSNNNQKLPIQIGKISALIFYIIKE